MNQDEYQQFWRTLALRNYELSNNLAPGTASIDIVQESSAGIDGWAKWEPT